jgi:hypothetical protein
MKTVTVNKTDMTNIINRFRYAKRIGDMKFE